jgi:hypothetical protein
MGSVIQKLLNNLYGMINMKEIKIVISLILYKIIKQKNGFNRYPRRGIHLYLYPKLLTQSYSQQP